MKQALYHKFHLKKWFVFISFVYFNYINNEEIDNDDYDNNNNKNNSSNYIIDLSEEKDSTKSKNQKKW